jgi:hypothetical protein
MTDDPGRSDNDTGPWLAGTMQCLICARVWEAMCPIEALRLECPDCGYMNALPCPDTRDDDNTREGWHP